MTKAQQAPIVVASAPNAPAVTRTVTPAIDPGDLARLLQFHLKRVGCDPGVLDGKWTEQSMHALQEFNKREKTRFDVKVASIGALDAVKEQKGRICPLVCPHGKHAEGSDCVANEPPHKRAAKRPSAPRSAATVPTPPSSGCSGTTATGGSRVGC